MKTKKASRKRLHVPCNLYLDDIIDRIINLIEINASEEMDNLLFAEREEQEKLLCSHLVYAFLSCGFRCSELNKSHFKPLKAKVTNGRFVERYVVDVTVEKLVLGIMYDILEDHINLDDLSDNHFGRIYSQLRNAIKYANIDCVEIKDPADQLNDRNELRRRHVRMGLIDPDKCYTVHLP